MTPSVPFMLWFMTVYNNGIVKYVYEHDFFLKKMVDYCKMYLELCFHDTEFVKVSDNVVMCWLLHCSPLCIAPKPHIFSLYVLLPYPAPFFIMINLFTLRPPNHCLYFWSIHVYAIDVPKHGDIVSHFRIVSTHLHVHCDRQSSSKHCRSPQEVRRSCLQILLSHLWPGWF